MSRCYPYPLPAYAGKSATNEALICTIKLQRDSEKTKSEKKDRRKEKKEKKRDNKSNGAFCNEKKIPKDEKLFHAKKFGYPEAYSQIKLQESDNMEKSSLTEEHGRPCCSSDSTENSGKRKRQSPPHATNNTRAPGTVIKIVLNPRKKEDCPTPSSSNAASLSLPIGKVEVKHPVSKLRITPPKSNATQQLTIISSEKEKFPCPDKQIDQVQVPSLKEEKKLPTLKEEKKLPRPLRKYKALFENWVPSSMGLEPVEDEEDWLMGSKKESKRMKSCKEEVVLPNCGNPSMQPQALYLSDVDIYALPVTVPF